MSKTIKYLIQHEVDKDLLCDQDLLDKKFNGSWQEFLKWFWELEQAELLIGIQGDKYPPKIIAGQERIKNE